MEGDSSDGSQEGSDSSSESEEEDTAPKQIDEKRLQELSDDEEKENLQRYQQQKLLNESQVFLHWIYWTESCSVGACKTARIPVCKSQICCVIQQGKS